MIYSSKSIQSSPFLSPSFFLEEGLWQGSSPLWGGCGRLREGRLAEERGRTLKEEQWEWVWSQQGEHATGKLLGWDRKWNPSCAVTGGWVPGGYTIRFRTSGSLKLTGNSNVLGCSDLRLRVRSRAQGSSRPTWFDHVPQERRARRKEEMKTEHSASRRKAGTGPVHGMRCGVPAGRGQESWGRKPGSVPPSGPLRLSCLQDRIQVLQPARVRGQGRPSIPFARSHPARVCGSIHAWPLPQPLYSLYSKKYKWL